MTMRRALFFGAIALIAQPSTVMAQSSELNAWLQEAMIRRSEALADIDLYLKRSALQGVHLVPPGEDAVGPCVGSSCEVIKVETVERYDGTAIRQERPLSPTEVAVLTGNSDAEFMRMFGQGLLGAQAMVNDAIGGSGLGLAALGGADDPVLSLIDPTQMFGLGGMMYLDAARALESAEESLQNSANQAQTEAGLVLDVMRQLESRGIEDLNGLRALLFFTDRLDMPAQNVDGQSLNLTSASVWLDPERYTVLKHRFEGTATQGRESREFFIEVENSDFRNPPGCGSMLEPYRKTMRMGGILDDEQAKEMDKAREQLADFEAQLAAMPAAQRAQVERMMGSQMKMLRGLVNAGGIEFVQETEEVLCNPDLASLFRVGPQSSGDSLVLRIQELLIMLGYDSGRSGVLDTQTTIAISQFQAENGLDVTGEATPQLLGILQAAAAR